MLLSLLVACSEPGLTKFNTPPGASILSPSDGSVLEPGALVEFQGIATDNQDLAPDLAIAWQSSIDGLINSDPADVSGNLTFATNSLSPGDHVITLQAVDTEAESASVSIGLTVGDVDNPAGAPTVVLLGPASGGEYAFSDGVNVLATVTDDTDAYDTLFVELLDVPDGTVWTGNPSSTGTLDVPIGFSEGAHSLTVRATDSENKTGTANVAFTVLADNRPKVTITAPADGSTYDAGDTITFRGTASDDTTAPEDLAVHWSSDISGTFSEATCDSSGDTIAPSLLAVGTHTITLTATDVDTNSGSDSIVIIVEDPLARDDDFDGFSENAGDCDDGDSTVSPDTTDICDDVDNDCDGALNDPYWDAYEPNSRDAPYEAGSVSGFLWTSSTLTLSGMTLSDSTDEDWIRWDAEDETIIDNVSITVTAKGFSGSGAYVLELWSLDTGGIVDSDSGYGSLGVSYDGDVFDGDEDNWAVRVYATSWPSGSCSTTYDLTIHS